MSIIETKFRKGYVETPELRTNGIVCNKFEYTGELTKESGVIIETIQKKMNL